MKQPRQGVEGFLLREAYRIMGRTGSNRPNARPRSHAANLTGRPDSSQSLRPGASSRREERRVRGSATNIVRFEGPAVTLHIPRGRLEQ